MLTNRRLRAVLTARRVVSARPARALGGLGPGQDLRQAVPWESWRTAAVAAGHVLVGDKGVGDGFCCSLDDRGEERVHLAPRDEGEAVVVIFPVYAARITGREPAGVGGGNREEDVARRVRSRGAGAGQAQGYAPGHSLALAREKWRVRGDNDDHRPGPRRDFARPAGHRVVVRELLAEVDAVEGELCAAAEVGLQEDADGVRRVRVVDRSRRSAVAALELVAVHPGAAADAALVGLVDGGAPEGLDDVLLVDMVAVDVVEVAVPGLCRDG